MWHIIGECLERSRSMEGWERWLTRCRCEVLENVFERTEEDVFSREANNTYGYMGEGNYASNIKKQGKSHTSGLTKPNMEGKLNIPPLQQIRIGDDSFFRHTIPLKSFPSSPGIRYTAFHTMQMRNAEERGQICFFKRIWHYINIFGIILVLTIT